MLRKIAFSILATSALAATPSWADMALATSKNCMACHHPDRKVVGPAFREVAKRYINEPLALAALTTKIQKGGAGIWGLFRCQPTPKSAKQKHKN
jgi:cytochrome c